MNWYLAVMKNYAGFSGRAHRTEYWMYTLIYLIAYAVLVAIDTVIGLGGILAMVFALAHLVPSIAVAIRRLHDTGRSGWWLLLILIPLIGAIVLIVFYCQDSHPGDNQFGPNPKGLAA